MASESTPQKPLLPLRFDRHEIAGSLGDIGTLLPLAALLIATNGLNPTVIFTVVGLTYLAGGLYYRLPMPVQPLKSFSALAIAHALGASVIAAGAVLIGATLLLLAVTGAAERLSRCLPGALVRGIQLGVGLILVRVGLRLCTQPGPSHGMALAVLLAAGTLGIIIVLGRGRMIPAALVVVVAGAVAGVWLGGIPEPAAGVTAPLWVRIAPGDWWLAATLLVLPQLPLTLTNSVPATQDVAERYFGPSARRVTPRALTAGLGVANVVAGLFGGMPVCHGSSGLTAHHRFGARTGGAAVMLGAALIVGAIAWGPGLVGFCRLIPPPVLGAMLLYVGAAHCLLVRDTRGRWDWAIVLAAGGVGALTNHNGYGLAAGLGVVGLQQLLTRRASPQSRAIGQALAVPAAGEGETR